MHTNEIEQETIKKHSITNNNKNFDPAKNNEMADLVLEFSKLFCLNETNKTKRNNGKILLKKNRTNEIATESDKVYAN